jgi:hypothetical protein
MKTMVVTGLSNEQDFTSGESVFILILNREIRVPVSEELATKIIQQMYQDEPGIPEISEDPSRSSVTDEDDGVDQI